MGDAGPEFDPSKNYVDRGAPGLKYACGVCGVRVGAVLLGPCRCFRLCYGCCRAICERAPLRTGELLCAICDQPVMVAEVAPPSAAQLEERGACSVS